MSKHRSTQGILREISPGNLERELENSQRDFIHELSALVGQMTLQAESAWGGKGWGRASWKELSDKWWALVKAQVELLSRLESGALPKWWTDQQTSYEKSPIGQLLKQTRLRDSST